MSADGRGLKVASSFVNAQLDKLRDGHIPYFVTDGYRPYLTILFRRFSCFVPGNRGRGRPGRPRRVALPDLNHGVVEKTRDGMKLKKVRMYSVHGHVPDDLLNTSAVERMNLTIRLFSSRARRRTVTFGRSGEAVQASLDILRGVYNLCTPHSSISVRRRDNGGTYVPITPAMKLGLTDHRWSIREMLAYLYRQNIN